MDIRNVLVTGRLREALRELEKRFPGIRFDFQAEGEPAKAEYDGYIGFALAPGLKLQALKWVHSLGAGVDGLLLNGRFSPGTLVTRTVGEMPRRIARYCRMCLLMEAYRLPDVLAANQRQIWRQPELPDSPKEVLVFGTGAIGREIAWQLSQEGYSCSAVSRSGSPKAPFQRVEREYSAYQGQEFAWLINALPLTRETVDYFDWELFSTLGPANFINIGRGRTVVEADLLRALDAKLLGRCYLDVTATEPLPPHSPLWRYPDIVITPHIAGLTAQEEAVEEAAATLTRILAGQPVPNTVDLQRGY
ncbi:MAG TPA: NAD(P)-dependent oxidoreductase [Bacillota bacterium]|nr:NAD(P)-dependent oxidoreductase [Bacillota bacterium]